MIKNIRNDSIFIKPKIEKNKNSKKNSKISNKRKKNEYKNFYIFSLISIFLIFSFFSLPDIIKYFDDRFVLNKTIINVSKKILNQLLIKKIKM